MSGGGGGTLLPGLGVWPDLPADLLDLLLRPAVAHGLLATQRLDEPLDEVGAPVLLVAAGAPLGDHDLAGLLGELEQADVPVAGVLHPVAELRAVHALLEAFAGDECVAHADGAPPDSGEHVVGQLGDR